MYTALLVLKEKRSFRRPACREVVSMYIFADLGHLESGYIKFTDV